MDEDASRRGSGSLLLGRLEGRVESLEIRMNRNEDAMASRLSAIEQKIDLLQQSVAQGLGGVRVAHWIGAVMMAVAGFAASHFWPEAR